jgi:thioredoxin-dependent peroxiredoxin
MKACAAPMQLYPPGIPWHSLSMKTPNFLKKLLPLAPLLMAISPGATAPDFSAQNQDGKIVKLSDLKGKFVLLFFYPKNETPGCTKEACEFRDNYTELKKLNTVVYGISRQDAASHKKFIAKHSLPFDLLVDDKGDVAKAFGVGLMPIVGFHKRMSVLIGPDGKVARFYENVDPSTHVPEVIADIKKAGAKK